MTRAPSAALIALGLVLAGCDPAKTGYYHGTYPDPASFSTPSSTDYLNLRLRTAVRRDVRRWEHSTGLYGLGVMEGRLTSLWSSLAYALDAGTFDPAERYSGSHLAMGTIIGVPNYVFLVSQAQGMVEPTGPSGERLVVSPGFHAFRRTCSADNPNHFEEVPPDTALVYDTVAADTDQAGLDPYLEACGLHPAAAIDLGDRVGRLPPSGWGGSLPVTEITWAPGSDVAYMLAGQLNLDGVEILSYSVVANQLAQIAFGDYHGPLEVANGGASLLVTQVKVAHDPSSYSYVTSSPKRLRLSLSGVDLAPLQTWLPVGTYLDVGVSPVGLLSPDGNTLATTSTDEKLAPIVVLIDIKSGSIRNPNLAPGRAFAWHASGAQLLVQSPTEAGYKMVSVDGSLATDFAASDLYFSPISSIQDQRKNRIFWTAFGPKAVIQGGPYYLPDYDDGRQKGGVGVYDLVTGQVISFVEPSRQAPPSAPLGVVAATAQVFAWAIECLSLGETSCTSELRRLSLATGAVDVVARADGTLPFAVSPDGTKLLLAYQDGVYLKTLQP